MMNRINKILLVLIAHLLVAGFVSAQIMTNLSRIQPAGIMEIAANNLSQSESVNWSISTYYMDEGDLTLEESPDTLFATGDTTRVLFIKKVGKYTYYKIVAWNEAFTDSITVQVLNRGVPERYLFRSTALPDKSIEVFVVLPNDLENAEFVMVMHGVNRNSLDYIQAWKNFGKNNNYICAAPTFTSADWPRSLSYNLGNMFTSTNYNSLNPESEWSFTITSEIHDELVEGLGLKNEQYDIWGHSAGAQFVHRMMTFKPDYKIRYAVAANAGWYTLPDLEVEYPFGLQNDILDFDETFIEDLAIKQLVIMRGTDDIVRDSYLNTSAGADAQGQNRYERAKTYFNYAEQIDSHHKWQLIDVENVGHDYTKMAVAAQEFLLNPTVVKANTPSVVKDFELYQNYPNPFNPTTTIEYTIPDGETVGTRNVSKQVKLVVYDMLGQEVSTLVDAYNKPGTYKVGFNAAGLPSGIYFYRFFSGEYSLTNKMILLK